MLNSSQRTKPDPPPTQGATDQQAPNPFAVALPRFVMRPMRAPIWSDDGSSKATELK